MREIKFPQLIANGNGEGLEGQSPAQSSVHGSARGFEKKGSNKSNNEHEKKHSKTHTDTFMVRKHGRRLVTHNTHTQLVRVHLSILSREVVWSLAVQH